jgi:hypothetical protein
MYTEPIRYLWEAKSKFLPSTRHLEGASLKMIFSGATLGLEMELDESASLWKVRLSTKCNF